MADEAQIRMDGKPRLDPVGLYRRIPLLPHQMRDRITSFEQFFVLVHLGVPHIERNHWRLSVTGLVQNPLSLSMDDLEAMPSRTIESVFQCAGNPLEPKLPTRRVANVEWSGVPLSEVIRRVSPKHDARYLWSSGLDYGGFAGRACDAYRKDLPLDAIDPEHVLIATRLNGRPLTAEHGFPARLVVPGWYGTNSVKWLSSIEFSDRLLDDLFTTTFYNDASVGAERIPVWGIPVESIITSPVPQAVLKQGAAVNVEGWAWAQTGVSIVEISSDGLHWARAALGPRKGPAWQAFSFVWHPRDTGPHRLTVRAASHGGHVQPLENARNAVHSVEVTVSAQAAP